MDRLSSDTRNDAPFSPEDQQLHGHKGGIESWPSLSALKLTPEVEQKPLNQQLRFDNIFVKLISNAAKEISRAYETNIQQVAVVTAMEDFVKKIEINCDMGEGFGKWKMVSDSSRPQIENVI